MDRRSFIKAIFSGVMIASIPISLEEASSKVEVFHEHEHYTADKGIYNVWYVHDEFWYLLSDQQRAPFEFDSREKAHDYVTKVQLTWYDNSSNFKHEIKFPNKEGMVQVRSAPQDIHDMSLLRQEPKTVNTFMINNGIVDPIQRELMLKLFTAKNGAEQSQIWCDYLDVKEFKRSIYALQFCNPFASMIRKIYCGSTYHSTLAKLQVFSPPQYQTVARS